MRNRLFAITGLLAVALFAVACGESDADLAAKVKTQIATDRSITDASHIDVSVQKKIATLSGSVESPIAKERAVALARGTEGVTDVVDRLAVVPPQASIPANTAASAAPDAGSPTDATITSAIQSKLRQDKRVAVAGAKIDVDTRLGIVTLSGTVPSEQVKRDAMQIAQDTAGVERVEDRLTVRSS